jgi:hypothetical protein
LIDGIAEREEEKINRVGGLSVSAAICMLYTRAVCLEPTLKATQLFFFLTVIGHHAFRRIQSPPSRASLPKVGLDPGVLVNDIRMELSGSSLLYSARMGRDCMTHETSLCSIDHGGADSAVNGRKYLRF